MTEIFAGEQSERLGGLEINDLVTHVDGKKFEGDVNMFIDLVKSFRESLDRQSNFTMTFAYIPTQRREGGECPRSRTFQKSRVRTNPVQVFFPRNDDSESCVVSVETPLPVSIVPPPTFFQFLSSKFMNMIEIPSQAPPRLTAVALREHHQLTRDAVLQQIAHQRRRE